MASLLGGLYPLYQSKGKVVSGSDGQKKVLKQLLEGKEKAEQVQVYSLNLANIMPTPLPALHSV